MTWKKINWEEQPLGKVPDKELAERLGKTLKSVQSARCRRSIKPYCPEEKSRVSDVDWSAVDWNLSNKRISLELGVSAPSVAKFRPSPKSLLTQVLEAEYRGAFVVVGDLRRSILELLQGLQEDSPC